MSDAARGDTTRSDAASSAGAFRLTSRGGRSVSVERATRETSVQVDLELDGDGRADVATGIGFLDHLLSSLAQGAPPAGRQEPGYGSSWWDRQRAS